MGWIEPARAGPVVSHASGFLSSFIRLGAVAGNNVGMEHGLAVAPGLVVDAIGIRHRQEGTAYANNIGRIARAIVRTQSIDAFNEGVSEKKAIAWQWLDIPNDEPPCWHLADYVGVLTKPGQFNAFLDKIWQIGPTSKSVL